MSSPVTPATQSVDPAASAANSPVKAADASGISADFETFLTLLTAQLSNQDPLNPLDGTEFVAQLASFSAVEQQTRSNTLLEQISGSVGRTGDLTAAASWVGREVAVPGRVVFDGNTAIEGLVDPVAEADGARLIVSNDFGQRVTSLALSPDERSIGWDGTMADGTLAPVGSYTVSVEYAQNGEIIGTVEPALFQRVREARLSDGKVELVVGDGRTVPESEPRSIR